MSTARAELWSRAGTLLSPLSTLTSLQWQDALNEPGTGSFAMPLDDPDSLLVIAGCEVRCYLDEVCVFTFIVDKDPQRDAITPDEEAGQKLSVSGRGHASAFADAKVYPYKGVAEMATASQTRQYTFASPDFANLDDWTPAVEVDIQTRPDIIDSDGNHHTDVNEFRFALVEWTTQGSGDLGWADTIEYTHEAAPRGWLDTTAYWIWGIPEPHPVGLCYFRKDFFLAAPTEVTIAATADNHYTLYLDGTPIIGDQGEPGDSWQVHKIVEMTLFGPATYTLAAVAENGPLADPTDTDLSHNPAGFLASIYTTEPTTNALTGVIVHTDASWTCLSYPAYVPGWTPGQIIADAVAEAQARSAGAENPLLGWTLAFTGTTDSAGAPWDGALGVGPYVAGFALPVGGSVLDIITGLVDNRWIDYRARAATRVLDVWNPDAGGAAHTAVVLASTGVVATSNILSLQFAPQTPPVTRMLVKSPGGFFELQADAAIAQWGVHEGYLVIDAMNIAEARRQAQLTLNDMADPVTALVIAVDPHGAGDVPYANYRPGDYISAPNAAGVSTSYRLHGMTVTLEADIARATFALELNSRILTPEREQFKLYQTLGRGVVGSSKVHSAIDETTGLAGT